MFGNLYFRNVNLKIQQWEERIEEMCSKKSNTKKYLISILKHGTKQYNEKKRKVQKYSFIFTKVLLRLHAYWQGKYRTCAIITRGLYIFYPIFHCGLYCRAVSVLNKAILQFLGLKSAVYNWERFQIKSGL